MKNIKKQLGKLFKNKLGIAPLTCSTKRLFKRVELLIKRLFEKFELLIKRSFKMQTC